MRVLVIGGISQSLINFRGKMLEAMVAAGHEVIACAGEVEPAIVEQLSAMQVVFHAVELERRGTSVVSDYKYFQSLRRLISRVRPDVVLSYTVKPVVYGSLAAARCGVPLIAAMITGAGAAQPGANLKQNLVAVMARRLYARALRHASVVFFQNEDDSAMFQRYRLLGSGRVVRIAGSGVDNRHYQVVPTVTEPITFLLIARLLVNKGVREYVAAAAELRGKYGHAVRCLLVGPFEAGGGGISAEEVRLWHEQGTIEYLGPLADVRAAIAQASIYVLPSYREGTPRTVLEAMSMGRAVITTDAPGCRETVLHDHNGYLVPVRNAAALAAAMERFITNPSLIASMGERARAFAEAKYDVNKVNRVILSELGLL